MPRYVIPKGAYNQQSGGKFESTETTFVVHLLYDQQDEDGVCESFAQNANDAHNDLSTLGVYIDVGRPLRIDQTSTGGANVDPVLKVYSAGSPFENDEIPMVCEGYTCTEDRGGKMWTITAIYRAVSYEDPNHVEAKTVPRSRMVPAWRVGDLTAIDWNDTSTTPPINPGNGTSPYGDTIILGDIGGRSHDVNTQPRNFIVEGWNASFSFVIRAPYYEQHQSTSLTVDPLWTLWTTGYASQSVGKRSNATEWGESPAAWWPRGAWIVELIDVQPINSVDHKVTVTMRYDEWQLCDQLPAQVYGGPVLPKIRDPQPPEAASDPELSTMLMVARFIFWSNPYPEQRTPFTTSQFPYEVYDYIADALVP
jgi:hypothetical protein|tara:strand:+ start:2158 stop:3255 length:1098 start_codon:yes stop_codon:yes gene_type:complete